MVKYFHNDKILKNWLKLQNSLILGISFFTLVALSGVQLKRKNSSRTQPGMRFNPLLLRGLKYG